MSNKAKEQAIEDIKADLQRNHKAFIAFRSYLNSTMDKLVEEQLQLQTNLAK